MNKKTRRKQVQWGKLDPPVVSAMNPATCVVCLEDFLPQHGVLCGGGRFPCGASPGEGCLSGHVRARGDALRELNQLAAREAEALAAGDDRRARELGGAVHCPVPGRGRVEGRGSS